MTAKPLRKITLTERMDKGRAVFINVSTYGRSLTVKQVPGTLEDIDLPSLLKEIEEQWK